MIFSRQSLRVGLAGLLFRYTLQQCWARPGGHTSAGLRIGAPGAAGAAAADAQQQLERHTRRSHGYNLHIGGFSTRLETSCGGIGGGQEPAELQATQWRLRWRTGDVAQRRRWRTGAGGHRGPGSPQPESWTGGGKARARTRRAGVCALLDWENLPGRCTRLLRLE